MDEKKEVIVYCTRELKYTWKKKMTKEEYDELKTHIDDGGHGADIAFEMGADISDEPDDFDDDYDIESDWNE